ncbi:MAG: SurA N-terminal domain-containing protein [Chthoniobacter sp.]
MLEGVAGVVNKEVITHSQVRELVGPKEKEARETLKGMDLVNKMKELRTAAIAELVDRTLILQEVQAEHLLIPESTIDERLQSIINKQFGGDEPRFLRSLATRGYSLEKFREFLRDELAVETVRAAATSGASTPEEAKQLEEKWLRGLHDKAYIKIY